MPTITLADLKDAVGDPIIFLTIVHPKTGKIREFTDRDLPAAFLQTLLALINQAIN